MKILYIANYIHSKCLSNSFETDFCPAKLVRKIWVFVDYRRIIFRSLILAVGESSSSGHMFGEGAKHVPSASDNRYYTSYFLVNVFEGRF